MEQRREVKQTREEKGGKTGSEESEHEERRERDKGERKKKKQSCPHFFTVFRPPEFGNPRSKVGLLDKSYE